MEHKLIITLLLIVAAEYAKGTPESSNIWAVLVAGSNGYENYRHQADVCHAYHVLREHGVPSGNIITMMYDDIAYNHMNPRRGQIINAVNGSNVYEGVVRDYIGKDVNSTNFLKILLGDEEGMQGIGSGRVLKSGPDDYVFVNFVDHGAAGLICFPNDTDDLFAHDLVSTLSTMYAKKMFAKMVLYIEACESGSMFDKLLRSDMNIFAVTAAKPGEDSYACCWDETVQAYLGDVFSVNWMDDSDWENLRLETLSHQFSVVVQETNTSNPQEYGTLTMGRLHVGQFMGMKKFPKPLQKKRSRCDDAVRSPDVPVAVLQRKLEKAESHNVKSNLHLEIKKLFKLRRTVDQSMKHILSLAFDDQSFIAHAQKTKTQLSPNSFPCYKKLARHWFKNCYGHSSSPYALRKMHVFTTICEETPERAEAVLEAMNSVCPTIAVRRGIH